MTDTQNNQVDENPGIFKMVVMPDRIRIVGMVSQDSNGTIQILDPYEVIFNCFYNSEDEKKVEVTFLRKHLPHVRENGISIDDEDYTMILTPETRLWVMYQKEMERERAKALEEVRREVDAISSSQGTPDGFVPHPSGREQMTVGEETDRVRMSFDMPSDVFMCLMEGGFIEELRDALIDPHGFAEESGDDEDDDEEAEPDETK